MSKSAMTNNKKMELNNATRTKIIGNRNAIATRMGKFMTRLPFTLIVLNRKKIRNTIIKNK